MNIRLVVDENISWRIKRFLPSWDVIPVNEIPANLRLSDMDIWKFAKTNNYAILTFDEDFIDIYNLYSYPPKVLWLRTGNISTVIIADHLLKMEKAIIDFLAKDELGVYEIYL